MSDNRVQIAVNGVQVQVLRDSFLLLAVEKVGVKLPTLCHHKDLTPSGNCRLCVVEVEQRGKKRLVTACNYPVRGELG